MRYLDLKSFFASLLFAVLLAAPDHASAQTSPNPAYKVRVEVLDNLLSQAGDKIAQGQLRRATQLLTRCVQLESRYPPCHRVLGMVYNHQGKMQKAIAEQKTYMRLTHQAEDPASLQGLMLPFVPALMGAGSLNNDDD